MYPDTDLPPKVIEATRINRLTAELPERPWDRLLRYKKLGLHAEMAEALIRDGKGDVFDRIMQRVPNVQLTALAYLLTCQLKNARRRGHNASIIFRRIEG